MAFGTDVLNISANFVQLSDVLTSGYTLSETSASLFPLCADTVASDPAVVESVHRWEGTVEEELQKVAGQLSEPMVAPYLAEEVPNGTMVVSTNNASSGGSEGYLEAGEDANLEWLDGSRPGCAKLPIPPDPMVDRSWFCGCRVADCPQGSMAADALRWNAGTDVALISSGRINWILPSVNVTLGELLYLSPELQEVTRPPPAARRTHLRAVLHGARARSPCMYTCACNVP
eukprot:5310325-Prymnesium_polylepis.1